MYNKNSFVRKDVPVLDLNAFTAGVEPGGLTHGYEIKILVCYLLGQIGTGMTFTQISDALLHRGGPAYVPQPKLSPHEAVALIHEAGGIAVLAHPSELVDKTLPERLLAAEPFDGIEVWHPSADARAQAHWLALAKEHGLLVSGGSDFHGIPDRFPTKLGIWQVQYDDVKGVIEWK